MNLRKRYPINYYEPQEPSFDDYLYCDHCADFVYEYCSIHGGLLVVPDDRVPAKTNYPSASLVPRAALTIPKVFLHIAPSTIPGAGLGVFATLTLPRGVRFGPFRGRSTTDVESTYCWQLHGEDRRHKGVIDAQDPNTSNWMRYVNCARHWCEQNLVAYQYQGQIYYRTIKVIPRYTELLVFYGGEFAHLLGINLKQYDSEKYYSKIKDNTPNTVRIQKQPTAILLSEDLTEIPNFNTIDDDDSSKTEETNKNLKNGTIEDFVIIDEETLFHEDSTADYSMQTPQTVEFDRGTNEFHITFNYNTEKCNKETNDNTVDKNICEVCNKKCHNRYYLHRHVAYKHGKRCHLCAYKTNTTYTLLYHIKTAHGIVIEKEQQLRAYILNKMSDERTMYPCQICDKVYVNKKSLKWHINLHHSFATTRK